MTGDILAKTVKADQNAETVLVEKIENLIIEQAAVRAQGIDDFLFAAVLFPDQIDRPPDFGKRQKRFPPVEIDESVLP